MFCCLRMDSDLGAGGDSSTRRKMEAASDAVEITPLEMYDSARAKIAANLRWLFAKAYGIGKVFVYLRTADAPGVKWRAERSSEDRYSTTSWTKCFRIGLKHRRAAFGFKNVTSVKYLMCV